MVEYDEKKTRNFWSGKKVSDLLKEIIEPDAVDVSSIQCHDELNPLIWDDNDKMKDDVRETLLKNAKRFIEFSGLENINFEDIILTGSIANYNYNENSDIDVHVVMDFNQIGSDSDFVSDYLKMKKTLWNQKLPIQIKGHDVEMYYQEANEPHHSTGTYSLLKNEWINKPIKQIIDINTANVKAKSSELMNSIDDLEQIKDTDRFLENYIKLKDRIKKLRQTGLENEGEYSSENLAFKILRNSGYLEKLINLKNDYLTNELSLNQ